MMGGSINQAKRRSASIDTDSSATSVDGNVVNIHGNKLELATQYPNQEDLLAELAKKRTMNMTISQKIKNILTIPIENRPALIEQAKKAGNNSTELVRKLESSIPIDVPTSLTGPQIANNILQMHSSIKALIDVASRPSRIVMKAFETLDLAMKMAVSNFQADHQAKQSSCFPALSFGERNRKYKQDGYLPADSAHRTCIGCNHNYVDEPNSNKFLQQKYETMLREFENKKKAAQDKAKKNGTTKRIKAPKLSQPY